MKILPSETSGVPYATMGGSASRGNRHISVLSSTSMAISLPSETIYRIPSAITGPAQPRGWTIAPGGGQPMTRIPLSRITSTRFSLRQSCIADIFYVRSLQSLYSQPHKSVHSFSRHCEPKPRAKRGGKRSNLFHPSLRLRSLFRACPEIASGLCPSQ